MINYLKQPILNLGKQVKDQKDKEWNYLSLGKMLEEEDIDQLYMTKFLLKRFPKIGKKCFKGDITAALLKEFKKSSKKENGGV